VIVRPVGDHLFLITQPDHARLAETIMAAWRLDRFPSPTRRDTILLATGAHDDGWIEEDGRPTIDPASGTILDFRAMRDHSRQAIWPRAVARLSSTPYAAALVAQHAIQVYDSMRDRDDWQPFFTQMERLRDEKLAGAAPLTLDALMADYFFVRMGDLLSLTFCNGWTDPGGLGGHRFTLKGSELTVTGDPFRGADVPLTVNARRLPNRRFVTREDAAAAFGAAPHVLLNGVARGLDGPDARP
jgi:hypothetical protein